ncbi:MAG: DUF262 domain-containing protein [Muribaculaceae bacterium]|nr:DUF262 domain-containing protein [Muribaculaceae bacterium]
MEQRTQFKRLKNYIYDDHPLFVIPNYQRGYKWSVKQKDKSSLEHLLLDLVERFNGYIGNPNSDYDYFLQGVTVTERVINGRKNVVLIDGQQRTTSIYLILWYLSIDNLQKTIEHDSFDLSYDVRECSRLLLSELKKIPSEKIDNLKEGLCSAPSLSRFSEKIKKDMNQDAYYFIEATRQIHNILKDIDKDNFQKFLLDKVSLLYIVVNEDKAVKTFTMMNGNKATMYQEELIKAEMLHAVSSKQTTLTQYMSPEKQLMQIWAQSWESNSLRSKYAREWDKWLYWWNRKDVKDYFNTSKPMGLLLEFYALRRKSLKNLDYKEFKQLLSKGTYEYQAKQIFKDLRDLQKSFEDLFSTPKIYNYLKMSLLCNTGREDMMDILLFFISNKYDISILKDYANWRLVGATHREYCYPESLKEEEKPKEAKAENVLDSLSKNRVYGESDDLAFKQLLRLNVEEYNRLLGGKGQIFDFSIWKTKSLEHIYPKSRVYHVALDKDKNQLFDDDQLLYKMGDGSDITERDLELLKNAHPKTMLDRQLFNGNGSEHCIGNLVLLDVGDNSKFGPKSFEEKKALYFNPDAESEGLSFKSRGLLHSMYAFAKSSWGISEIQQQRDSFIEDFKKTYSIN